MAHIKQDILVKIFEKKLTLKKQQELVKSVPKEHQEGCRNLQIIKDSVGICLSSKNQKTALLRKNLVNEKFSWILKAHILDKKGLIYLGSLVNKANKDFSTLFYLNGAKGLQEKASKMKSIKGQLKYLKQVVLFLEEGLTHLNSDKSQINSLLVKARKEVLQLDPQFNQNSTKKVNSNSKVKINSKTKLNDKDNYLKLIVEIQSDISKINSQYKLSELASLQKKIKKKMSA